MGAEPPRPASTSAAKGPGSPGDAMSAFASALASAAKTAGDQPAEDARVSAAFALGWQMAELYRPPRHRMTKAFADDLPGLGTLEAGERLEVTLKQVQAGLAKLGDPIKQAGLTVPDTSEVEGHLGDTSQFAASLRSLHVETLAVLTATDFRLGKSYGLGRALADTCRTPSNRKEVVRELNPYRVATLEGWIDDLSSALPPHAGHSVGSSIRSWAACVKEWEDGRSDLPEHTLPLLRRQGELWRALLSGEKLGQDMLEIGNYLDAASALARRMHMVLWQALKRFWYLAVLALVLFAGGIALAVVANTSATIAAGLAGILTSLGLTWKGIGSALGGLAGKLERPLWGAELDRAITSAITLLPGGARHDYKGRGKHALEAAEPPPPAGPGGELGA
jgi:hypothetical protein